MKHVIIGDLRGRDIWKKAPLHDNAKIIFLGDYVDSLSKSNHQILDNLEDILDFKKNHPDRVVLLIGNHDAQYMHYPLYRSAGFRPSAQFELSNLFDRNRHHFRFAYQVGNVLFTHAGITNTWFGKLKADPVYQKYNHGNLALANMLNLVDWKTHAPILYATCRYRTGEDSDGGPLWADYAATSTDALEGYHQIVGHTQMDDASAHMWPGKSVTYLDVLHRTAYFHEIDLPVNQTAFPFNFG